jgi:hypothetical protein
MKKLISILLTLLAVVSFSGCNDADIASQNLSTAADQFEVNRRIVFYNGITTDYILEIDGFCSLGNDRFDDNDRIKGEISITCKTGEGQYKKHFLGLSDNVTYFVEQIESENVGVNNYRVIFKPSIIIPDIELH